jgi:adenine-specific DNA-methyltransferase
VDAIRHGDKRTNIPTADAHEFIDPQIEEIRKVRYARDESLDPQLVWKGKYDTKPQASENFFVDAPPIYIQEKIDPRVLIENLRRTAARSEEEPELALFEMFDGLNEMQAVDFYKHDANWSNRMIVGDSLQVMASLAERERLRGKVQMIYIDPPYGIKFGSNWQVSVNRRDVKDGRVEDAAREAEQIKAFRDTWELGIHSYLSYLRDRLTVARELLAESGSCFVQMGDENLHLVRALMDEIFGSENFCSLIAMQKSGGTSSKLLPNTLDYILWFAKNQDVVKYRTLLEAFDLRDLDTRNYRFVEQPNGEIRGLTAEEKADPTRIPSDCRPFRYVTATSQGISTDRSGPVDYEGTTVWPGKDRHWSVDPVLGFTRLQAAGRLAARGKSLEIKRYLDDFPVQIKKNVWLDTGRSGFGEEQIYVVQTNTKAIQRCLLMSTDPGDLVLDPTCGSGTTAYVAERWGRRWITVDSSRVALALARQRIVGARFPWYLLADSSLGYATEQSLSSHVFPRNHFAADIRHGFVYERVQRIQPTSIANNPDVGPGMTPDEIDAAIKRHADFELLYDRPFEDKRKVRVAGPFTVESLSPHRSLAFAGAPERMAQETLSEVAGAQDALGPNFEQSILENLATAGIQNGRRKERIEFETLETYAGSYIQAVGVRKSPVVQDGDEGAPPETTAPSRIAVAIGPQYGTVSPSYVKKAAREAINAEDVDLLCILGFAFDPQVTGVTEDDGVTVEASDEGFANVAAARRLGRIPVLMVRMNADLLMGEELKKTRSGNLFTVFGEPDIGIQEIDDGLVVDLKGVDVYDPTIGEVRSSNTDLIALWMIDTNYNEESFFVRHCYFTGSNDPYKRLKTALKADIDPEAWASLHSTVSRPFPKPETGKIAVKVINDYGDEVMKVFEV